MDDLQWMAKRKDTRLDLVNKTRPVKKARTYLKPGQTAPQGSEEQEGERGGRYYESEGGGFEPSPEEPEEGFVDPRSQPWTPEDAAEETRRKYEHRGEEPGEAEADTGEEKPSTIGDVVENIVSGDEEFNPAKYTNRSLVRLHALIGAEMDSGRRSEREKMWLGGARDSVAAVLRTRGKQQDDEEDVWE